MARSALKFAIALAGLGCGSALMAESLVAFANIDGELGYYDRESIKKDGNVVYIWTYWDASKNKKVKYREIRIRYKIDCYKEVFNLEYIASYSADGKIIDNIDDTNGKMTTIVPESTAYRVYNIVCE